MKAAELLDQMKEREEALSFFLKKRLYRETNR